jgi:hypothetical protein
MTEKRKPTVQIGGKQVKIPAKKVLYDIDCMKKAVAKCDVNIKTFQDAIANEEKTKRQYQKIVETLEEQLSVA